VLHRFVVSVSFVRYIVISVKINKKLDSYINELLYICYYFHVYVISVACKEVLPHFLFSFLL
jgi:hypothetical protein